MINKMLKLYVQEQINNAVIHSSPAMLAAYIFKSLKDVNTPIAKWNTVKNKRRFTFSKLSANKQNEIGRHIILELPFTVPKHMSIRDLCIMADNTGYGEYILNFVSCVRQPFPVYPDVKEHVDTANKFFKSYLQMIVRMCFVNNGIYIVNNKCYATMELSLAVAEKLSEVWSAALYADVVDLYVQDYSGNTWDIKILQRNKNDWCTFIVNARRSVFKDFDLHKNCICSNISAHNKPVLNRETVNTNYHLVTIFDVKGTLEELKYMLSEKSTIHILETLIEVS